MSGFLEVNEELKEAVKSYELKMFEFDAAIFEHLKAEAMYENELAKNFQMLKLEYSEATVKDIDSMAKMATYDNYRLPLVVKESSYRSLKNAIEVLKAKIEVYREISFNLRSERKI